MKQLSLPNLVLAGVGKAGTTSLFWYLSQHPTIYASRVKETRYFLPLSEEDPVAGQQLAPLEEYAGYFTHGADSLYRMEATPHYFYGGKRLISGLSETLPDVRIVLLLRDPVDRLWSIFRFAKSMLLVPKDVTLDRFVAHANSAYEARTRQTVANRPYWTSIRGSIYSDFIPSWIEAFSPTQLRVLFFEDLKNNPGELVSDLCSWLEIDSDVSRYSFSIENQSMDYRWKALQRIALFANRETLLRNRRSLKRVLRPLYRRINQTSKAPVMDERTQIYLRNVFAASNARLGEQLAEIGVTNFPVWLREPSPAKSRESRTS